MPRDAIARDDLSGVEEHIAAMVEAETPFEAARVLASALEKHLGGQYVECTVHVARPMNFAELLLHCRRHEHQPGQIVPTSSDPLHLRRLGGDA